MTKAKIIGFLGVAVALLALGGLARAEEENTKSQPYVVLVGISLLLRGGRAGACARGYRHRNR